MKGRSAKKVISVVPLFLTLVPSLARADGFVVYTDRSSFALHTEETQVAAINYEDGREKLLLAVRLGELKNNSVVWMVPVPANASDVKINILGEFPRFEGDDIFRRAEEARRDAVAFSSFLYTAVGLSQIYTFPLLFYLWPHLSGVILPVGRFGIGDRVEVHTHIEKEGIVTEVVTAEDADALYDYLKGKNITIDVGSISIIDDYIGETYSFIVSWVKSTEDESRTPAIFVDFPTDEIYYPLKPTSVYGNAEIPILLYVVGYATPKLYPEIESYTEYRYFEGGIYSNQPLEEFFGDVKPSGYTRILIGALTTSTGWIIGHSRPPPSSNFRDDLWIERLEHPPASVERARRTLLRASFLRQNIWCFVIGWWIVASLLAGGFAGYIMFRNFKRYAFIGLANCLTIVGVIVDTFLSLKEKRVRFIGLFSMIFLLVDFFVIPAVLAILLL